MMNNITELEKLYGFDLDELLKHYVEGIPTQSIADALCMTHSTVRHVLDKLDLPIRKQDRKEAALSLVQHLEEMESNGQGNELRFLHKKLVNQTNTIQRLRDEVNYLRAVEREHNKNSSIEGKVLDIVRQALPIKSDYELSINLSRSFEKKYRKHVTCLLLSDLHVEEAVNPKNVGSTNAYNWDIMESRLDYLFNTWYSEYRGEGKGLIVIAGDVISGIIHDSLENATKPVAEAVHDLAELIFKYILGASVIMPIEVLFVSGNHERLSSNIKATNKGFDLGYLFAQILKAKLSISNDVVVEISTTGYIATDVNGRVVGAHHGDHHREAKSEGRTFKVQEAFKNVLNVDVYHILEGHTHKFSYHNTNRGASIVNGSMIGSNNYGHTNGFVALRPSQTIIRFDEFGEVDNVKQVFLDKAN